MGEARRRGSFEVRKAEAIKAGRDPEERRQAQRAVRVHRADTKRAYYDYMRKLYAHQVEKQESERRMAREALRRVSLEG